MSHSIHDLRPGDYVKVGPRDYRKIASLWGVLANGRLAKPSQGGFGCVTLDGARVDMWHAVSYHWAFEIEGRQPMIGYKLTFSCDMAGMSAETAEVFERINLELRRGGLMSQVAARVNFLTIIEVAPVMKARALQIVANIEKNMRELHPTADVRCTLEMELPEMLAVLKG